MTPDFKKIKKDFENYTRNIFIKGTILSIILVFISFIILFIKLLLFKIDSQNEHIQKNSEIINKQIEHTSNYILLIKDSFEAFKKFDDNYKYNPHLLKKDELNRFYYNSIEFGTFISLYHPITKYLNEFSALQHVSIIMKSFQKQKYVLWSYYYSRNKFVYVHPSIKNPISYKFSEKSYNGDILQNTIINNETYITPIYNDAITQKKIFSLSIPIFKNNIYQGTFAVDIDLEILFKGISNLNKNISLFISDRNNQHYCIDNKKNSSSWFYFNKHKEINSGFILNKMIFFNTKKLQDGIILVSYFSVINTLYETIINPNLIYFIFVILIFYIFISINYFKYMKPQQSILIGVLEYLNHEKKLKELNDNNFNSINKDVFQAFKYLIHQFTLKIKIDNDIRISKETIKYFIKNNYFCEYYGYIINPALNFSGDYVRIFNLNNSEQIFFIADVSGKGIGSLILVNQIDLFFNINAENIKNIFYFEETIKNFNNFFFRINKNCDFIAFKAIHINYINNNISIINAGLPSCYFSNKKNEIIKIENPNSFTPLGIIENEKYKFIKISNKFNNEIYAIYSCTDGILEQKNKIGETYENKFLSILEKSSKFISIEETINFIWNDFLNFIENNDNQNDDFTILIIKLKN